MFFFPTTMLQFTFRFLLAFPSRPRSLNRVGVEMCFLLVSTLVRSFFRRFNMPFLYRVAFWW